MASVDPAWLYDTTPFSLADGSEHTVFTVATGYLAVLVQQIMAADTAGAANKLTVKARISGVDYVLDYQRTIAANVPYDQEYKPLVLKKGDSIKLTANAGTLNGFVAYAAQARKT